MRRLLQSEIRAVAGARLLDQVLPSLGGLDDAVAQAPALPKLPKITVPVPLVPGPGNGDDGGDPEHPPSGGGGGGGSSGSHRIVCDQTGCSWV